MALTRAERGGIRRLGFRSPSTLILRGGTAPPTAGARARDARTCGGKPTAGMPWRRWSIRSRAVTRRRPWLNDQIRITERTNIVQSRKFREALEDAMPTGPRRN